MKKSVLIIDDEKPVRTVLRLHLVNAGYSVDEAKSGRDGMKLASENHYDLVLCDLKLGDMSGVDIIKILSKQINALPIVAVSGFINEGLIHEVTKAGNVEYLSKPFLKEELLAVTRKLLHGDEIKSSANG